MKCMGLVKALVTLTLLGAAFSAAAIPIVGTSNGSFSNLSSCDVSGSYQNCRIVDTGNGNNTQVQWGSQSGSNDFINPSKLTATDVLINTNTSVGIGVKIGQLDWYNSATLATSDLTWFDVDWRLRLSFTQPAGPDPTGTEVFELSINNPINPPGDRIYGLQLADLTSLGNKIDLGDVLMTNLRYVVVDGLGTGTSKLMSNYWYNDEYNWSSLHILADFYARVTPPTTVPEPTSVALLGLGLFGVAMLVRPRRPRRTDRSA